MPLSDWAQYKGSNPGNIQAQIDILAPLVGTGSLQVKSVTGSGSPSMSLVPSSSAFPSAVTRGRLRSLFKIVTGGAGSELGLSCMHSQSNITTSGNAYFLRVLSTGFTLRKGFVQSSTQLASVTITNPGTTIHCMQMEWAYDTDLGGTALILSYGDQTDFSDLTELITYVDTSSPLSTSVGEGLTVYGAATHDIRFDKTRLEGPA